MPERTSLTRRRFLRTAAVGGAACTLIPASAWGAPERAAPSERITVGMIGMGRQALYANLKQFLTMPDVQVVAVCDVDSWRLAGAKQKVEEGYAKATASGTFQGCSTHVDYNEVLGRKEINAVMISTPDHWHVPMALAAFAAGKDVSLEKPITRSIGEGRKLADTAARLKRIFRVDSELRSNRSVHRAATLVRNGRIGKIHTVTVGVPGSDVGCPPQPEMPVPAELDYERWQGPAPRAYYTENRVHPPKSYGRPGWMRHLYYCDGMITNWTTHWNDVAMWSADLERTGPVEIEATGEYPPADSFWNVLVKFDVKMRFANGVKWNYRTEKPFFKIEGTEGWVYVDYRELKAEPATILDWKPGPDDLQFRFKSDKQDFIDCVKSREETLEPAEVGHRVTSLGHLGQIAIQLGRKLKFDPEKETFPGDDEANAMIDKPIHAPRHA